MTDLADIVIRVDTSQLNAASGATEELRRSTLSLIGSVDRVASAQISHANAMRTLRNAVNTGILSQQEMARTTVSLTQRLEAQGLTLNNLGQVVERNTGSLRRFGSSGMQQVGYQVGDFAVQVQGGTNALVALGQQGTQLLGIFGPAGAVAGAFFAIGTAILNVYFQTQKFKEAAANLKTGISELRSEIKLLQSGAMGIAEEFGKVTTGLERTVRLIATVTLAKALGDARTQLAALTKDIYTSTAPIMTSTMLDQRYQETQRFKRELDMGGAQATQMADMELALARAKTDKERLGILNQMNAEIEKQVMSGAIISDEGLQYLKNMALAQQGLQTVVNLQGELAESSKLQVETEKQKMDAISVSKDLVDAQAEAQRMLNGGLSVAGGLHNAAVMAQQEQLRLAKEKEISEQSAAEKAEYLRQAFHLMAGETTSLSAGLKELPPILDKAAIAAYKLAAAMADTRTAASAVLSSMVQMDAARLRKQGQVQAAAAGFVGRPELDLVGNRAAVNAARSAILEEKNAPETGGGAKGAKTDPLVELQKQIALQEELNGKTEAERKVREALGDNWKDYSPLVIKGLEDQIQKQIELEERLKDQQQIFDTVKTSMEDAFMGMVDGTKSAKDAFKQMAAAIIKELYNVLVVQRMVGSFDQATGQGSGIMGLIFKGVAGAFGGGGTPLAGGSMRANGGPVSSGQPYLVGERGPELIIPKSSGMVLTNNQTKTALGGSSNESYVVHNNINVTGSDSVMVRQEIAKMIPQISSATKAAMIDAKRRGGQMGNAFR